jgi:hypothetical protein
LERLNLAGIEPRVPILALFDAITAHTPSLSHLFFSTPQAESALAAATCLLAFGTLERAEIRGMMALAAHPRLSVLAHQARTPASLQRIFIQEGLGTPPWVALYEVMAQCEKRLVFLPLGDNDDPTAQQRKALEKQWVDRMNGGDGCWSGSVGI